MSNLSNKRSNARVTMHTVVAACVCVLVGLGVVSAGRTDVMSPVQIPTTTSTAPITTSTSTFTSPSVDTLLITTDTPWMILNATNIDLDYSISAFNLALRDVQLDWYKVLGTPPLVLDATTDLSVYTLPGSASTAPPAVVFFGTMEMLVASGALKQDALNAAFATTFESGPESHGCAVLSPDAMAGGAAVTPVVCAGTDLLGAVYATYMFSHEVLSVDKLWQWVEREPLFQHAGVTISSSMSVMKSTPTFRHRGFFINDEDLIAGFGRDPLANSVFSIDWCDRLYQVLLRLGGNTVILGTAPYPDEESMDLANRRGLYLAEHHITILGANTFQWPEGLPYSFAVNPEMQEYVWRATVAVQKDRNMLWTVGYRGLNDYPFWNDDPSFDTPAKRGKLIGDAMQKQVDIVNEIAGPDQRFCTYLWDEMRDLFKGGYLKIPDGVSAIFADDGTGVIENIDIAKAGDGIYYHAMMESGSANQLTEMVPPARLYDQIGQMIKKKATNLLLLNTSDFKPAPITIQAIMEYVWNANEYIDLDPAEAQKEYLLKWATQQFDGVDAAPVSPSLASSVATWWADYFTIPFINDHHYGEQWVSKEVRELTEAFIGYLGQKQDLPSKQASDASQVFVDNSPILDELLNRAFIMVPEIPSSRRNFYSSHTIAQISMHHCGIFALGRLADAVTAYESDKPTAIHRVGEAISFMDLLLSSERNGEFGVFKGWHRNDELTNWFQVRDLLISLQSTLTTGKPSPVRYWRFGNGVWSTWYYYDFAVKNFPTFRPSIYTMDQTVRIRCLNETGGCQNTPTGGKFAKDAVAWIELSVPNKAMEGSIYYTVETGNGHLSAQMHYTQPFAIQNPTVKISAFVMTHATAMPGTAPVALSNDEKPKQPVTKTEWRPSQ
eukprot:GFYU01018997.1.p1 GENE.GFYU01018997.1~~GFYU01018997.1.p1  ORF type:complete len:906 (+),score=224.67 GFYU01018997.1:40-2718(+)